MNRPFNEAKYEALLEGLEATEIAKSDLEFSFRLDSEYYQKEYLSIEKLALEKNGVNLGTLTDFLIGPFGSAFKTENYEEETTGEEETNYRYIRGKDVKPFFLMNDDNKFIPESDFSRLQKYKVLPNDVLVSVVGTLGNASIALEKELPAIFSCKSTILRNSKINSFYLLAYLNSDIGRKLLLRKTRGAVQAGLNLDDLKTLTIPQLSDVIQFEVEELIRNANNQLELSQSSYKDAENLLLTELGLLNWQPTEKNTSVASFADSFFATGRLDGEFYQPKYEEIANEFKGYVNGYKVIESACVLKDENFNPQKTESYRYIELANIGGMGEISNVTKELGENLPTRARRIVNKGDVIVSSIEGSLQKCAVISEKYDNALCSTGFYVLQPKFINSETLLVLIKSEPMQNLLKQACSGTILTSINKDDLLRIPIPIIRDVAQDKIRLLIQQSQSAQAESKRLLELAKKAVEAAIEQGEETALKLIRGGQNNA